MFKYLAQLEQVKIQLQRFREDENRNREAVLKMLFFTERS